LLFDASGLRIVWSRRGCGGSAVITGVMLFAVPGYMSHDVQEEGCPDINVITERLTVGGLPTRFEDQSRLPMGISVNSTAYSAKLMTAIAVDPMRLALVLFGDSDRAHSYVQDSAALAAEGEAVSWWQLVVGGAALALCGQRAELPLGRGSPGGKMCSWAERPPPFPRGLFRGVFMGDPPPPF
jgi:hypothetical protein